MKFKNIKKYLVILMAVVLVASFAAIPTSAAVTGNGFDYSVANGSGWEHDTWVYCDGDEPHYCYVIVYDYNLVRHEDYKSTPYWGPIMASVECWYPYQYQADACIGYWEYGAL